MTEFDQHITQANSWEDEIAHAKHNTNIQRMALFTTSHVSRELLRKRTDCSKRSMKIYREIGID